MPSFTTRRRVPYSRDEMYAVVADVERYPEFLPLCEALVVHSRTEAEGSTVLVATMTVGYKSIREAFTSRVTLVPAEPSVLVEFLDGPFHHLTNRWRFTGAPGGSEVDFFIDYEFRSAVYRFLMGGIFDRAFHRYAEAFEARAHALYGAGASQRSDASVIR